MLQLQSTSYVVICYFIFNKDMITLLTVREAGCNTQKNIPPKKHTP